MERQPEPPDAHLSVADVANRCPVIAFQASRRVIRAVGLLVNPGLVEVWPEAARGWHPCLEPAFAAAGVDHPAQGIPIDNPSASVTGHLSRTALSAEITGRTERYTCAAEPTMRGRSRARRLRAHRHPCRGSRPVDPGHAHGHLRLTRDPGRLGHGYDASSDALAPDAISLRRKSIPDSTKPTMASAVQLDGALQRRAGLAILAPTCSSPPAPVSCTLVTVAGWSPFKRRTSYPSVNVSLCRMAVDQP